jgi:hypothetical protein
MNSDKKVVYIDNSQGHQKDTSQLDENDMHLTPTNNSISNEKYEHNNSSSKKHQMVEDNFLNDDLDETYIAENIEDVQTNLENTNLNDPIKEEENYDSLDYSSNDDSDTSSIQSGGDYDNASVSSLNTEELLKVDPLYFRLTKFLQSGGVNVAQILMGIKDELKQLNTNLANMAK